MKEHQTENRSHEMLAPEVADRLLQLLSTSDGFRAQFMRDPAAALYEAGHEPAAALRGKRPFKGQPYYCMTAETLAPKDEIRRSREALKGYLTQRADHRVIYYFEAEKMDAALRRG